MKKRKLDTPNSTTVAQPKKKSPLADLPQNYYAPPVPMTRDELSAWRKEQRRERNRQSAAESRNKTKLRIEELEGEVLKYKVQCNVMKEKMAEMERQIQMLTVISRKKANMAFPSYTAQLIVTPPGSHPSSPSTSPSPPVQAPLVPEFTSSHTHCTPSLFPPLLSTLDHPVQATTQPNPSEASSSRSQSKEHLIELISRQA